MEEQRLILLAGNPNVGKTTLYNRLTGRRRHTGNWPGKTVAVEHAPVKKQPGLFLADLPGSYSLAPRSPEERLARDALCFGDHDGAVVVCAAPELERSLLLALQVLECTGRAAVCINLMDEAARRGFHLDIDTLAARLGVPVMTMSAGPGRGTADFPAFAANIPEAPPRPIPLPPAVEAAAAPLAERLGSRWAALELLCGEELPLEVPQDALAESRARLAALGLTAAGLIACRAEALGKAADELLAGVIRKKDDRPVGGADRLLTDRRLALPVMGALLGLVLWLTVAGANVPSAWLASALGRLGLWLEGALLGLGASEVLTSALVDGVWRTTAWVVSVMLPPMAIFFPLFTLLEEAGLLPRLAFALDGALRPCGGCGKQGLTMCMGLGCNAVGVTGCRIMDAPRERLAAQLTNSFMPCNGRFPALILLTTAFFAGGGALGALEGAALLLGLLALAAAATMGANLLLSATFLRGQPGSFALELPPLRRPGVGRVLLRSLRERTAVVLGRALAVAAPAGLLIWLAANISVGNGSLLSAIAEALDPIGQFFCLDGAILLAFLLGLPANEIVLPILLLCYAGGGTLGELAPAAELRTTLEAAGWTAATAGAVTVFFLMHWPCGTTLLTLRRETGSWAWTALGAALPTAFGLSLCLLIRLLWG